MKHGIVHAALATALFPGTSGCSDDDERRDTGDFFSSTVRKDSSSEALCPSANDGDVCYMTQPQAEQYCMERDSLLPVARTFGEYSAAKGAKGILEVAEVEALPNGEPPDGYARIDSIDPGGVLDSLYFSHEGYDPGSDGLEEDLFWTASLVASNTDYAHVFYGEWGGGGGEPDEHKLDYLNAVRCLANENE